MDFSNVSAYMKSISYFLIAYTAVMLLFVYLLRLPEWVTQNKNLVGEYYFTNRLFSFGMDLFFIVLYWLFAYVIWTVLKIKSVPGQLGVLLATTILLTTVFWQYFSRKPLDPAQFFSRWFHTVGFRAVIYDAILLGILFIAYQGVIQTAKTLQL